MRLAWITALCVFLFSVLNSYSLCMAQVDIFNAGQVSFVDIGFDGVAQEIVAVGSDDSSGGSVASVFHLSSDHSVFGSSAVTGLGPNTTISGVSPNGLVISGTSDTSATDIRRIGIAWQRSALGSPVTAGESFTGFGLTYDDLVPVDAWNGGVVGSLNFSSYPGFSNFVFRAESNSNSSTTSFTDGPWEMEFFARVNGVSGDGTVTVGSIGDANLEEGVIWDEVGSTTRFDDSQFESVSPNGNFIGGNLGGDSVVAFSASIWRDGANGFEREMLTMQDGLGMAQPITGTVGGISDSGYAIIAQGFGPFSSSLIWHDSFNGIDSEFVGAQDFDEWLLAVGGESLPVASFSVVGIIENDGILHFAINSDTQAFIVSVDTTSEQALLGDVNLDNTVNFLDIAPFITLLAAGDFQTEADLDENGFVNFLDIAPFIELLSGS